MAEINLHPSWLLHLESTFKEPYMLALKAFLQSEKNAGNTVYPSNSELFNAFNLTPLNKVKVLILGQDPYHGPGQAHGLSFSVKEGTPFPPSLMNIFKELGNDLQIPFPRSGELTNWAKQGVLLLNATLTVRQNEAGSHQKKGWETFTDKVISLVSEQQQHVVFLLWGKFAQEKAPLINEQKHLVLTAPHPSPLSASRGFFSCKHFSKTNAYLVQNNLKPIQWDLSKPVNE
jgi:uracil-DNA glycosylase